MQYIKACKNITFDQIYIEWLWFKNHVGKDLNFFAQKCLPLLIIQCFVEIQENPRKKYMKKSHEVFEWSSTAWYKQTVFISSSPQYYLAGIYILIDEAERNMLILFPQWPPLQTCLEMTFITLMIASHALEDWKNDCFENS